MKKLILPLVGSMVLCAFLVTSCAERVNVDPVTLCPACPKCDNQPVCSKTKIEYGPGKFYGGMTVVSNAQLAGVSVDYSINYDTLYSMKLDYYTSAYKLKKKLQLRAPVVAFDYKVTSYGPKEDIPNGKKNIDTFLTNLKKALNGAPMLVSLGELENFAIIEILGGQNTPKYRLVLKGAIKEGLTLDDDGYPVAPGFIETNEDTQFLVYQIPTPSDGKPLVTEKSVVFGEGIAKTVPDCPEGMTFTPPAE